MAQEFPRPRQFFSGGQGNYGHLTLRNLAALAAELGDQGEARRGWQAIVRDCPDDAEEATEPIDGGRSDHLMNSIS